MTLEQIYNEMNTGSTGMIIAIQTHCGFEISRKEIERLCAISQNALEFQSNWENQESWTDEKNAA